MWGLCISESPFPFSPTLILLSSVLESWTQQKCGFWVSEVLMTCSFSVPNF